MSLDKLLTLSLKILFVVLFIEVIIIMIYMSSDNEEEFNSYMPNPIDRMQ